MKLQNRIWILLLLLLPAFFACQPSGNGTEGTVVDSASIPVRGDWVRMWIPGEPDNLNPVTHLSATGTYVIEPMYLTLYTFNPKTYESEPCLAISKAQRSADGRSYTFEIMPEAVWDNGSPITGYDYQFTLKAIFNPAVEPATRRLYYNFISDVVVDPSNPRKFTVSTSYPFFLAEISIGGIDILPMYHYDPAGLMKDIPLGEMIAKPELYLADANVKKFAEEFMKDLYARDPKGVVGSGAYRLEEWVTGDHITIVRKDNWWGDKVADKNWSFQNYPDKLIYKIIPDRKTAVAALKNGELDVMNGMGEKDFVELRDGGPSDYNFHSPDAYAYSYIALNTRPIPGRHKILTEKRVRQALAHLIDTEKIIKEIYYGFGKRLVGPILPLNKDEVHPTLKPVDYNPEKAKQLLAEGGWKDTNGDGTLDKSIDGKRTELALEFMISEGSNRGEDMIQLVKDECAKVGIKITGVAKPLDQCQKITKEHQFDMFGISNVGHHLAPDLEQVWSTSQWEQKGSNITGFGNAETDSLISQIRREEDPEKRKPLYYRIQEIIYDEQPAIFIRMPTERIAIHKRFRNAEPTSLRPGCKPFSFWVPKAEQKFK